MFAQVGGLGTGTLHGAYSARCGSQVISARMPWALRAQQRRSVNVSVPLWQRTFGNHTAGFVGMDVFRSRDKMPTCRR